jgi:hypothetical protein
MRKHLRLNAPKIIHEQFDDEVVIINLDSGSYYSVDKTGARIWVLALDGLSREEIIARIGAEFVGDESVIEESTSAFLDELLRESLVVAEPIENGPSKTCNPILRSGAPQSFVTPQLQKYTDMEELLLLDPVHEVDEMGWPKKKDA